MVWTDGEGVEQLRMELTQTKTGYTGDVYSIRLEICSTAPTRKTTTTSTIPS